MRITVYTGASPEPNGESRVGGKGLCDSTIDAFGAWAGYAMPRGDLLDGLSYIGAIVTALFGDRPVDKSLVVVHALNGPGKLTGSA